ncbi:radical sam domain protein [Anaeramoeba flamelloides]|uniref:Radical sam domain protein n=1 Tax=Anaeramoeba flamelloides TaxID=1746091 RepID=A0ABQ8Z406_9EUKA|nr:radical sam domain protein [Anaeramoeba flamelloides]
MLTPYLTKIKIHQTRPLFSNLLRKDFSTQKTLPHIVIEVPGSGQGRDCPNRCESCVSDLTKAYGLVDNVFLFRKTKFPTNERLKQGLKKRLSWLCGIGCQHVILTGCGSDPILNRKYLELFDQVNQSLQRPFTNIDIQTSGICINEKKLEFLKSIGVNVFSLSLFSLLDHLNAKIMHTPPSLQYPIKDVCQTIKNSGVDLRISLNVNSVGFSPNIPKMVEQSLSLGAQQITFRKLYSEPHNKSPQNQWIQKFEMNDRFWENLLDYFAQNAKKLNNNPFSQFFHYKNTSFLVDQNCMNKLEKKNKYFILRKNGKIYTQWDDTNSLIF